MSLSEFNKNKTPKQDKSHLSRSKKVKGTRFREVNKSLIRNILSDNENTNTAKSKKKVDKILTKYLQQSKQNEK